MASAESAFTGFGGLDSPNAESAFAGRSGFVGLASAESAPAGPGYPTGKKLKPDDCPDERQSFRRISGNGIGCRRAQPPEWDSISDHWCNSRTLIGSRNADVH